MGIQTMGSLVSGQQPHLQSSTRKNSWFSLTLDVIENQLRYLGKPVGSMKLDELLINVWTAEETQLADMNIDSTSSARSIQRQASMSLAESFSGKTVKQVWRDIQCMLNLKNVDGHERGPTLGETTLEDFLVKAGNFVEASLVPPMKLNTTSVPPNFPPQLVSSLTMPPFIDTLNDTPSSQARFMPQLVSSLTMPPFIGTLNDTPSSEARFLPLDTPSAVGNRDASDAIEKTRDRRLKRKIKNRESAARSRARKQAYQDELLNKVARLEEENMKLKREKEIDEMFQCVPLEPKYQLRRTSSI